MKKLNCDSPVAQHFVDEYWQNRLTVAELADAIVSHLVHEIEWDKGVCSRCGHYDRHEPNYCSRCGGKRS